MAMTWEHLIAALEGYDGPSHLKLVLVVLARHANERDEAWPSLDTIARQASVSRRQAWQSVRTLIEQGVIVAGPCGRRADGTYTTTHYTLNLQRIAAGGHARVKRAAIGSALPLEAQTQVPVEVQRTDQWKSASPELKDLKHKDLKHKGQTHSHAFDAFWKVYPRHEGETPAREAFAAALKKATSETIIAGAQRYRCSVQERETEDRFIALATNWLGDERWTDEYAEAPDPLLGVSLA